MEELLSAAETAKLLGVQPQTLAKWRMVGRGPRFFRVGSRVRYRQTDVEEWLERQAVPAGA